MRTLKIFNSNIVILAVFFFVLGVNMFAVFSEDKSFVQFINVLSVPIFVLFALLKYRIANISFFFFCFFVFLSDASSLLFQENNIFYATRIFYIAACIHLLILVLPKLSFKYIDKSVKAYLLLMFFISTFFLSLFYNTIESGFVDNIDSLLFAVRGLVFVILGLASFGVYLKYQNKKSIFFLTAVICFGFSVLCNSFNTYVLSEWQFVLLNRLLHIVGIYFIFKFIIEESQVETFNRKHINDTGMSTNILA